LKRFKYTSIVTTIMLMVDDRENPKVVNKLLMRMGADTVKVCRMASADYRIGKWGIEAKEINDLYRSILGIGRTRTIVAQLRDLQESCENPMLLVYGTKLKPWVQGTRRPNAKQLAMEMARIKKVIHQFKITFYQRFPKIKYMEVLSMDDFVEWLVVNHTQDGMALSNHHPDIIHSVKKFDMDPRIAALSTIQGVTPATAEKLLEKFGSLPAILRSRTTQKSLMEVQGVGRKRAKDILALRNAYENVEN